MALSYKARRRWSLVILVIGLPIYILLAMIALALINDRFGRPGVLVEMAVYVGLGVAWILPFRKVFLGIGQADPTSRDRGDDSGGPDDRA